MTTQTFVKHCDGYPCQDAKKIIFGPEDKVGGIACSQCGRCDVNQIDYDFENKAYYLDLAMIEDW